MRVLIDTNVILDFILKRDNFTDDAEKVFSICMENGMNGCIAAHTVPNLHYILRNHLTKGQRKDVLLEICRMFAVVGIDADKLISALQNDDFSDFEDCLQVECAKGFQANYIVTRNTKDFKKSDVPALEPSEFIRMFTDSANSVSENM